MKCPQNVPKWGVITSRPCGIRTHDTLIKSVAWNAPYERNGAKPKQVVVANSALLLKSMSPILSPRAGGDSCAN